MKIALIGDVHGQWDARDRAFFDSSDDGLLLFTGDLPRLTGAAGFRMAADIARLRKDFALIAGNHDCATLPALAGEILGRAWPSNLSSGAIVRRYRRLGTILGDSLVGYSSVSRGGVLVVGARPFAMDGLRLSFQAAVSRLFGVSSLADSRRRLARLIAEAPSPVIVLSHNGPAGLGSRAEDIYGVDFRPQGGDNGDADLRGALDAHPGKVVLVVSGHMHHRIRGGGKRTTHVFRDGTLYVNCAVVPRYAGLNARFLRTAVDENGPEALWEVWYDRGAAMVEREVLLWKRPRVTELPSA